MMLDLNRGDDGATRLRRGALAEKEVGIVPMTMDVRGKNEDLELKDIFVLSVGRSLIRRIPWLREEGGHMQQADLWTCNAQQLDEEEMEAPHPECTLVGGGEACVLAQDHWKVRDAPGSS